MNKENTKILLNIENAFSEVYGTFWFEDKEKGYIFDYMTQNGSDIGCSHTSMLEDVEKEQFKTLKSVINKEIELLKISLKEFKEEIEQRRKEDINNLEDFEEEYEMNKEMFEIPLNIFKNVMKINELNLDNLEFGTVIETTTGEYIFSKREKDELLCFDYYDRHNLYNIDINDIIKVTDEKITNVGRVL